MEPKGADEFEFQNGDGDTVIVNSKVRDLYSSPVINRNIYNTVAVLAHDAVPDVSTYLKNDPENTAVKIGKDVIQTNRTFARKTDGRGRQKRRWSTKSLKCWITFLRPQFPKGLR